MAAGKDSVVYAKIVPSGDPVPTMTSTEIVADCNSSSCTFNTAQLDKSAFGDEFVKYEEGLQDFDANVSIRSIPSTTLVSTPTLGLQALINYASGAQTGDLYLEFKLTSNLSIKTKVIKSGWNPSATVDGQSGMTFDYKNGGTPEIALT